MNNTIPSTYGRRRDYTIVKLPPAFTNSATSSLSRILSVACSNNSSTLAFSAASSTSTPSSPYSNHSYGLLSPSLSLSRHTPNEMIQLHMPSNNQPLQQPHEVSSGALYIYDLKTQRKKVEWILLLFEIPCIFHYLFSMSNFIPPLPFLHDCFYFSIFWLQCSLPLGQNAVSVNCMAFNNNCSLLVTGASDGMIRLFGELFQHHITPFLHHFTCLGYTGYSDRVDQLACNWCLQSK